MLSVAARHVDIVLDIFGQKKFVLHDRGGKARREAIHNRVNVAQQAGFLGLRGRVLERIGRDAALKCDDMFALWGQRIVIPGGDARRQEGRR